MNQNIPRIVYNVAAMLAMFPRLLLIGILLLWTVGVLPAQESEKSPGPRIELLTMNGGKPNLSATGEGISSYKNDEIYQRGKMTVRLLKPEEVNFKIELPYGYSLFNNLIYIVDTDISFAGLSDITFNIPSARTKETFAQLRILFPELDYAEPNAPQWHDITLDSDSAEAQRHLSETAIKQRLPDFKSRTVHGFIQYSPVVFLVALRDPTKVRNKLSADLALTGTGPQQVTEGQQLTYELKITNAGPDMATGLRLHAERGFSFISIDTSDGKCNMMAGNIECKIPSLEKGRSVEIKIVEQCAWGREGADRPPGDEPSPTWEVTKFITLGATERDPSTENNELQLTTEVFPDQNKGPVIEIVSPTLFQVFSGPAVSVPIRFKASDPDGFIKKVELFDRENGKSLGEPTLQSEGEYELIYKNVGLGRRWVTIVATDNLGRVASQDAPEFFVNGPAKVEIISPKAGSMLNREDGEITVTIHASSPSSTVKKVSLDMWNSDATAVGNDTYVVKVKSCLRKCRFQAIAVDDKGIESRSGYVEFTIRSTPAVTLYWFDGEYIHEIEAGKPLKVSNEVILHASGVHGDTFNEADIVKTEIFVDNALVCTIDEAKRPWSEYNCAWRPSPGKYKLHAVTTDEDGAVGKSEVIEVVIERP